MTRNADNTLLHTIAETLDREGLDPATRRLLSDAAEEIRRLKGQQPTPEREVLEAVMADLKRAHDDLCILSGDVTLNGESTANTLQEHLESAMRRLRAALAGGEG